MCGPNSAKCTASKETPSVLVSRQLLQVLVSHQGQAQHDLYQLLKMKCLWCSAAPSTSLACAVGPVNPRCLLNVLILDMWSSQTSPWPAGSACVCLYPPGPLSSISLFFSIFLSPFLCHLPHADSLFLLLMLNSLCTGLKLSGKIFDQRDVKFLVKDDLMELYCSRYKFWNGKLSMPLQFGQNVLFELWFQLLWL